MSELWEEKDGRISIIMALADIKPPITLVNPRTHHGPLMVVRIQVMEKGSYQIRNVELEFWRKGLEQLSYFLGTNPENLIILVRKKNISAIKELIGEAPIINIKVDCHRYLSRGKVKWAVHEIEDLKRARLSEDDVTFIILKSVPHTRYLTAGGTLDFHYWKYNVETKTMDTKLYFGFYVMVMLDTYSIKHGKFNVGVYCEIQDHHEITHIICAEYRPIKLRNYKWASHLKETITKAIDYAKVVKDLYLRKANTPLTIEEAFGLVKKFGLLTPEGGPYGGLIEAINHEFEHERENILGLVVAMGKCAQYWQKEAPIPTRRLRKMAHEMMKYGK